MGRSCGKTRAAPGNAEWDLRNFGAVEEDCGVSIIV